MSFAKRITTRRTDYFSGIVKAVSRNKYQGNRTDNKK
ncbi:hypothetical protein OOU_Y34scaffold00278g6 [Pyricularia oryzae Y34]|uniref:Uncharacterized protein n=2 Tax=Pyricularia oryzae TaxID=318829 RepID=A0AA97PP15_PYRO3|nr:hypothetical protein OOU_Y34scaffold00278g6 [Pyricularia oryzae Y34]